MKRTLFFIMGLVCTIASGQNINDVLRFSSEDLQGTARFQAMGGAFGALGGDLSSLNVNPAGSAVFKFSQFAITGGVYDRDNDAFFGNSLVNSEVNSSELNQAGGVFVYKSNNSPWKRLALAVNYDLAQNFDNQFRAIGNTSQGIDNYFLNYAQGVPFGPIQIQNGELIEDAYLDIGASLGFPDQQAFLGYQAGLIAPVDNTADNSAYVSNAAYSNVTQDYLQSTNGYNGKFTVNFAGQYEENLFVGASVNFHSVLYERLTSLIETGYDADSRIQRTTFDNFLRTQGEGFSFSLGAIAKVNQSLRLGASYQSPIWYRLLDDFSQRIETNAPETNELSFIDFNIVNLYPEYRIKTPSKFTGSAAIIFGPQGLLSFDYSYQDMSQAELRPTSDPSFASENDFIASQLKPVNTYRIGGEYRIERVSLRGGYRFEESPYEDETIMGNLEGFSAGIGYSWGPNRLDLAFARTERDVNELFYESEIIGNSTDITRINSNISLGYTLKF
ncbi:OmpP1/FadL family transporter [Croceivirga thetidis]|uniref:Aromatic hydrocarbon degradation protein n=1 Tax=Croceivirga thetidis TaxID=2721623 RepID=A0ABX1GWJ5_9FLAO|nr:outer membrane protein transport protein [Croceivirga thetidis]NKI33087.1 aromatic hydrocarbon degradation protein [Croceivirga thetidis]